MQPFAQETIKVRKNRRKEKRSSSFPPQLFLYVFGSSAGSAPAGLTGILAGILPGLECFAPAKISLRLLCASSSLESGSQILVQVSASSLWTLSMGQSHRHIPSHFPTAPWHRAASGASIFFHSVGEKCCIFSTDS